MLLTSLYQPVVSARLRFGLILAGIIVICSIGAVVVWQLALPASGLWGRGEAELVPFAVSEGESVREVAQHLEDTGLLRNQVWFMIWVRFAGAEKNFIAGSYRLPRSVNVINLTRLLTGAVTPSNEVELTFIEGWTMRQISDYLTLQGFDGDDFYTLVTTPARFRPLVEATKHESLHYVTTAQNLEGYLFPDTYRVYRSASPEDILQRMLETFTQKFQAAWPAQLAGRGQTVSEVVILASIVEREVRTEPDRALVADIFWRRLKAGGRLEADSTINYLTGKNLPAVTSQDLAIDSPYNTYRYSGLPPGPISNPGAASLKAVVAPTSNANWYFLTTPAGEVIYSETFEEHKRAKQKYLN